MLTLELFALRSFFRLKSVGFTLSSYLLCDSVTERDGYKGYTECKINKSQGHLYKGEIYMSVLQITKENFESEVMRSDKPVLIDFWASWCAPCRMLSPVVDEIAEETADVKVCKVNVDEQPELARQFQVMSIPMLAFIKEGKLVDQAVGVRPKAAIVTMIKA